MILKIASTQFLTKLLTKTLLDKFVQDNVIDTLREMPQFALGQVGYC